MRTLAAGLVVVGLGVGSMACGSSSPTAPAVAALAAPSGLRIVLQRLTFLTNEVQLTWTGNGDAYRVTAGLTAGGAESLSVTVPGTTYTWIAPRVEAVYYLRIVAVRGSETSAASVDLPIYTMDMRHVIDALIFRSGPMSDSPNNALTNPFAAVWPDGTALRVLVSNEAGETMRANSQRFADEYAVIADGTITGATEMTPDDMKSLVLGNVPRLTIGVRVLFGFCGTGAIACAFYGPEPVGPGRSLVTNNGTGGFVAGAHEMGHAYGLGHVRVGAAVRQELNFMMNPQLVSQQMTEPEKLAIRAAREGGIRPGWRRDQALAAGLVLPFVPGVFGAASGAAEGRALDRCLMEER